MKEDELRLISAGQVAARAIENYIYARDEEKSGESHIRAQLIDAVAALSAVGGST